MLLQPEAEWDVVARAMPRTVVLLRNFLLSLALLAPTVTIIGMLIFEAGWNPEYGYSMLRNRAPVIAAGVYVFEIACVLVQLIAVNSEARARMP